MFKSTTKAIKSAGFIKALGYSLVSAIVGTIIVWIAKPDATSAFGEYIWIVPIVNSLLVFVKQYADEKAKKNE